MEGTEKNDKKDKIILKIKLNEEIKLDNDLFLGSSSKKSQMTE